MPLITCPDCGKKISDAAASCIHCGRPLTVAQASPAQPQGQSVSASSDAAKPIYGNEFLPLNLVLSNFDDLRPRNLASRHTAGVVSESILIQDKTWRIIKELSKANGSHQAKENY